MPPASPQPWAGTRDATRLGQRAPQGPGAIYREPTIGAYMTGGRAGELLSANEPEGEDCLVLNVLTPATDAAGRPVLVYIHGGGFSTGSGAVMSLGDRLVVEEDVVLVTVNHRLGALGYLHLGSVAPTAAAANPGILDLVASLKWVRENIAGFGGDPGKVTIFGESGGAAKVGLLLAMPAAKGLFRGAIMQSGGVVDLPSTSAGDAIARRLFADLGLPTGDVGALRKLPAGTIIRAGSEVTRPVMDGRTVPLDVWRTAPATAAGVPAIVGYCADETSLFYGGADPSIHHLSWTTLEARLADTLRISSDAIRPLVAAYRAARPADDPSGIFFRITSDGVARPMLRVAELQAAQSDRVYLYRMEYDTGLPPGLLAFHTAELPLVGRLVLQRRAEELSRELARAWAAFARSGSPDPFTRTGWRPLTNGSATMMLFDEAPRYGADLQADARALLYRELEDRSIPILPTHRDDARAKVDGGEGLAVDAKSAH